MLEERAAESPSAASQSLADELVEKAAAAVGISPKSLFSKLEKDASLDAYADCLQPHEVEHWKDLAGDRTNHVRHCTFCQVLVREGTPVEEHARAYAAEAVKIAQTTSSNRFGAVVDFLLSPYKAVKGLRGFRLFGSSVAKTKSEARSI